MLEQCLRPKTAEVPGPGPGGLGDVLSTPDAALAWVSHGLHHEQVPVANMTVGDIRQQFADRFDIDPRCQAQIDGNDVGDDVVLRPGQLLMFVRQAGEKGVHPGGRGRRARRTDR